MKSIVTKCSMFKSSSVFTHALAALGLCINVQAEILSATLDSGYDSNPFQFSEAHLIEGASYFDSRVKYRQRFGTGFYLISNLRNSFYLGDAEDAGETKFNFGGGLKNKFKLFGLKTKYKFEARYYLTDRTYVSKITGQIATFSGQPIEDRYDASWLNFNASTQIRFNKTFSFGLDASSRDKSYQSYESLGLSNLDYSQSFLNADFIYNTDDKNRFTISTETGTRTYNSRIAKQFDGTDIIGSNLEYDYQKVGFVFRNKQGKYTWQLGFKSELREDNGGGFYNIVKNRAFAKSKYKRKSGSFVSGKITYYDNNFDNTSPSGIAVLDEDLRAKEGFAIEIEYNRHLIDFGYEEAFLHLKFSHEDFDNADPFYIYDQTKFQLGIKWDFY